MGRFSNIITAKNIADWGREISSRALMPVLLRRLIFATVDRIHRIRFPSDEEIQNRGWDGILEVERGNSHVPEGISVWEFQSGDGTLIFAALAMDQPLLIIPNGFKIFQANEAAVSMAVIRVCVSGS